MSRFLSRRPIAQAAWGVAVLSLGFMFVCFCTANVWGDYAVQLAGGATFTGKASDSGYDMDGNGLFEHLLVDIGVNVSAAGSYALSAYLTDSGGHLLSLGTLDADLRRSAPLAHMTLATGVQSVRVYFNGFAIRASGLDGPYAVHVELVDEGGAPLDSATFTTSAYNHLAFQGLLFEMQTVTDSGVDTNALPGFNLLRVSVQVNAVAAGPAILSGQLFAGATHVGDASRTASLTTGAHILNLDFAGAAIVASGMDGPYTVYLSIADANYTGQREHTTAAYRCTDFQMPAAFFTGGASDAGNDPNSDGLYDGLDVVVQVVALTPGRYTVHAIMQDGSGGFIQAREESVTLDLNPADVTLRFAGKAIYRHAAGGPYRVLLTLVDSAGNEIFEFTYVTSGYAFTDFQMPPGCRRFYRY